MEPQDETLIVLFDQIHASLLEEQFQILDMENDQQISEHYKTTMTQILTEVTAFPVRRAAAGNALSREELLEMPQMMDNLISHISATYAKTRKQVEKDIHELLDQMPVEDLRKAAHLRATNMLH